MSKIASALAAIALVIAASVAAEAATAFVEPGAVLYLHQGVQVGDHQENRTVVIDGAGHVKSEPGFVLTPYTAAKATFKENVRGSGWTFNGKTIAGLRCYSGGLEQVAISPNGSAFVCIDGVSNPRLILVRDPGHNVALGASVLTTVVDTPQVSRSVAFFGAGSVVFLRVAEKGECDTFDGLIEPTAAVLKSIQTGAERRLGCATTVVDRGNDIPALIRETSSRDHVYSLDGGRTWEPGNLAVLCGRNRFFWAPHTWAVTGSDGSYMKVAPGTNMMTCQVGVGPR